jgi:hypothetical protein
MSIIRGRRAQRDAARADEVQVGALWSAPLPATVHDAVREAIHELQGLQAFAARALRDVAPLAERDRERQMYALDEFVRRFAIVESHCANVLTRLARFDHGEESP